MADTKPCCANETCFACRYWEERVRWAENDGMMPACGSEPAGLIARVNGQHYVLKPFNTTRQSQWLGHQGQVFTFRFTDGRQYTSNDVWCQGEIPAHFRDRLPDNAIITIPSPNTCRHCGLDEREHMQRWKPTAGWHMWAPPTQKQILARMRARRAARLDAAPTNYHGATAESTEWSYVSDTPDTTEYCADCGDAECPRWIRIQERLDEQRMRAYLAKYGTDRKEN
ncbi:hypothetical protein [Streptomyces sp. NPDC004728]|uniref:hypothetical protein n=1 Tax=Streptomyces sp. NPDC004728 TaxID=3154289 RepID=UPI0033A06AF6